MVSFAGHQSQFLQNRSPSSALLIQLSEAHDILFQELENLDRMTLGEKPDFIQFTAVRRRLSQACLRRRRLSSGIVEFLTARLEGNDLCRLKMIQSEDQEMMRKSVRHLGIWTKHSIGQNWQAYCDASYNIRMHMMTYILLERQSLFPMLERLAAQRL